MAALERFAQSVTRPNHQHSENVRSNDIEGGEPGLSIAQQSESLQSIRRECREAAEQSDHHNVLRGRTERPTFLKFINENSGEKTTEDIDQQCAAGESTTDALSRIRRQRVSPNRAKQTRKSDKKNFLHVQFASGSDGPRLQALRIERFNQIAKFFLDYPAFHFERGR